MSSNSGIAESVFQAVDIIVNNTISGIAFDKTIECEIVDNADAKNGRYTVTDGSTKFEAYSEKTSYAKGSKVLVKIPEGNFSKTKYIEGLAQKDDGEPITYLSALNTIMDVVDLTKISNNIEFKNKNTSSSGFSLKSNSDTTNQLIWSFKFSDYPNIWLNDVFTSLYVEADFKTNLLNVKSGTYGLLLVVKIKMGDNSTLEQSYHFSSKEFFGNPYRFSVFSNQAKKINIKGFKKFDSISLYFYQNKDFKNISGGDYNSSTNDLFVKNVRVGLGTDLIDVPDNTVKLISLDEPNYKTMSQATEYKDETTLQFLWFNKSDKNKYVGFSDGIAKKELNNDEKALFETFKENDDDISVCGISIDSNNIIDTKNYDEVQYYNLTKASSRLEAQKTNLMPFDENSLNLMADIQDAHDALSDIRTLLNGSFASAFKALKDNTNGSGISFNDIETKISDSLTTMNVYLDVSLRKADGSFNTQVSFLQYYKEIFKYINFIRESIIENPPDITKDISRITKKNYLDFIESGVETEFYKYIVGIDDTNGVLDDIDEIFKSLESLENEFKNNYSFYLKYYNNFKEQFILIKEKYNKYKTLVSDKLPNIAINFEEIDNSESVTHLRVGTLENNKYKKNFFYYKESDDTMKMDDNENVTSDRIYYIPTIRLHYENVKIDEDTTTTTVTEIALYSITLGILKYDIKYYLTSEDWQKPDYSIFDNLYSIYWYRYKKDYEDINDPYGSRHWEKLTQSNYFSAYQKKNTGNEKDYIFEGSALYPSSKNLINQGLPSVNEDLGYIDNVKYWLDKGKDTDNVNLKIVLNPQNIEEKFKVILVYNHEKYESNELVFTNVEHPQVVDKVENEVIEIVHKENSQNSYPIYEATTMGLKDGNEKVKKRKIMAKQSLTEVKQVKDGEVETTKIKFKGYVYWYFPATKTQLDFDEEFLEKFKFNAEKQCEILSRLCTYEYDSDKSIFTKRTKEVTKDGTTTNEVIYLPQSEVGKKYLIKEEKDGYCKISIKEDEKDILVWIQKSGVKITYKATDGVVCFSKRIDQSKITENFQQNLNEELEFSYKIKDTYDPNNTQNTIKCVLKEDGGKERDGSIGFTFTTFGSNGTDYSLIVRPTNSVISSFCGTDPDTILSLTVEIYDKNCQPVDGVTVSDIKWLNSISAYKASRVYKDSKPGNQIEISLMHEDTEGKVYHKYGILKVSATASDLNGITLDTLYPIPWSAESNYWLSGPTRITYNSQGTLMNYDKTVYELFGFDKNKTAEIEIKYLKDINTFADEGNADDVLLIRYMPILQNNILKPCTLFVDNVGLYPVIQVKDDGGNLLFSQPLVIQQSRFESSFLNGWDGTLQIDEEGNTIMSAMVGAGIKNSDNSFSGVLMGNVEGKTGFAESGIGLYGFHHGGQSFGFNVDGTAFLGKSGAGRIEFDGNRSAIYSSNWYQSFYETDEKGNIVLKDLPPFNNDGTINKGTDGLCIDLDDGYIDAYNFKLTGKYLYLNANPNTNEPYLLIGDKKNNYIEYDSSNGLNISVTNLSISYALGENLLYNTAPLEKLSKELEAGAEKGPSGWTISPEMDKAEDTVVKTDSTLRKCIRIKRPNELAEDEPMVISQTLKTPMENDNYYTLSGKIYINTSKDKEVIITVGNKTDKITCEKNTSKWYEIKMTFKPTGSLSTFKIEDYSTQDYDTATRQHTLLYHLKLELGQIATAWCQSTKENDYIDKIYEYSKQGLSGMLSQSAVFDALTNNGASQGIYMQNGDIYINASAIGVGLLRSNIVEGTFNYTYTDNSNIKREGTAVDLSQYQSKSTLKDFTVTSINLTKGTLFDLNSGIFQSTNCNLKFESREYNIRDTIKDKYIAAIARDCLKYACKLDGEEKAAENIKNYFNITDEESELSNTNLILQYYDVDQDGKVTAADARALLRESAHILDNVQTTLEFNKNGFRIYTKNGTGCFSGKEEELFTVQGSAAYIKTLYIFDTTRKDDEEPSLSLYMDVNDTLKLLNLFKSSIEGKLADGKTLIGILKELFRKTGVLTDSNENEYFK